jgi:hypothetical protein
MSWIEVAPAYGRDYKNQKEVKADWAAGKDFRETSTGSYTNKQDADRLGLKVVVRYANRLKVVNVK